MSSNTIQILIKAVVFMCWLVLFGLLLKRDVFIEELDLSEAKILQRARSEEYQSIYFKESKIGFVVSRFDKDDDDWLLDQRAEMTLKVARTEQKIELRLRAKLSENSLLKDFSFSFLSPFYKMTAAGKVTDKTVSYRIDTGTNTITDSLSFPSPPMLATSRRGFLLENMIKSGEKRKLPWFDPLSLTGKESIIQYHGQESILIHGRVFKLHRFSESFAGTKVNSWLDDQGIIVKEESPAGFIFLKEPKFKAMARPDSGPELLSSVAVKIKGTMPPLQDDIMRFGLEFPQTVNLDLEGDRQTFHDGILTLKKEKIPDSQGSQRPAICDDGIIYLKAGPYIQSDHPEIIHLAQKISQDHPSPAAKVKSFSDWLYTNIEKRPVLGLPDALTTLTNKRGDCNEHAALFAAFARAVNIPTRMVAGVTHHQEGFYYHAWNEVCLQGQWISIDSTTRQFPADLSHIRLVIGELQEQVRLSGVLGKLAIEPLP